MSRRTAITPTNGELARHRGWSIRLEPLFRTDRYEIAMHPDGGPPGTLGCIGIALNSAEALGNRMIDYFMSHDFIRVWVIP